jgi:transcriptional regulator with XRE-family HTH domain
LNQITLAAEVGKGNTTIGNWENGVSQPNVEEMIALCNFFGVDVSSLITVDLAKTNTITDEHVDKFSGKNGLKNKQPGKASAKKYDQRSANPVVNEEEITMWLVLGELRDLSGKIDKLQATIDKIKK